MSGPDTKLKAHFVFFVGQTCGVEPNQNLELIVGPGDPISGNRTSNSIFYKWDVNFFLKPEKWLERQLRKLLLRKKKEVLLRRTLSRGSQNGIGVFSARGRRTTNWLRPWKGPSNYGCCWKGMPFAKLPCQNRHCDYQTYWTQFYQGNNFYNNYNKK